MSEVYESIIEGLKEAIGDAESGSPKLKRKVVSVVPVKKYDAAQVKKIRKDTGLSQKNFASYMGVSEKTVEAWEAGINHPSGTASRILSMMEMDENLVKEFPFIIYNEIR